VASASAGSQTPPRGGLGGGALEDLVILKHGTGGKCGFVFAGGHECPDAMAKSQVQKAKGSPLEVGNVEYGNDIT